MRLTTSIMIFTICVGASLTLLIALGIGGDELKNMGIWSRLDDSIVRAALGVIIGGIVIAFAASFFIPKGGEAAAIIGIISIYTLFGVILLDFIYKIPYIGDWLGILFSFLLIIIGVLDVAGRVTNPGGDE